MEARTQHSIFEAFKNGWGKGGSPPLKWRDWLLNRWTEHIDHYLKNGWHIIPIGVRSKKPFKGFRWSKRSLTREEAVGHVEKGGNLAIVAGFSKLVLLDYDSHDIDQYLFRQPTPCMITPNGYTFLVKEPFKLPLFNKLKKRYPHFDNARLDVMYSLLPLSVTCKNEKGRAHSCEKHDYRVREWVKEGKPLSFRRFVKNVCI